MMIFLFSPRPAPPSRDTDLDEPLLDALNIDSNLLSDDGQREVFNHVLLVKPIKSPKLIKFRSILRILHTDFFLTHFEPYGNGVSLTKKRTSVVLAQLLLGGVRMSSAKVELIAW